MILDGWGINPEKKGNAVASAPAEYLEALLKTYPNTSLTCSGEAVGLPAGIMGNSEVGHLNIGAGRIVYQDLMRIDKAIENGDFFKNPALNAAAAAAIENNSALHLMGLVSDGGVHSQLTHLLALLDLVAKRGIQKVYIHAILDGRDTAPDSGISFIRKLQEAVEQKNIGAIATVCGRYYAMDRDTRWDRTEKAYRLYTCAEGVHATSPEQAVKNAYDAGETDEFVKPVVITDDAGRPIARINDNDALIFFNFRADRARQITRAFTEPDFSFFKRDPLPKLTRFVTMTQYDESFDLPTAFPPVHLEAILGEVLSEAGLHQLRIAETEKYAHVTYFFNGGDENPFPNEDRCLIPSPREVATYDQKPEMSAPEVAGEVVERIQSDKYDVIILNFANMDMVGHTGIIEAAVQAVKTVDRCVKKIVETVLAKDGVVIITADHGNAEQMLDQSGNPHTAHTLNKVPLILVDPCRKTTRLKDGALGDIAPTMLDILGIAKPDQMTGTSLIINT